MLPVYTTSAPSHGHPDSFLSPGVDLDPESSSSSPSPAHESSISSSTDDGGSTVVGSETGESRENPISKVGLTELLTGDIDVNRLHVPHSDSKEHDYHRDLESIVIIPNRESETTTDKLERYQNEEEEEDQTTIITRSRTERSLFPVCEKLHLAKLQTPRTLSKEEDGKEGDRDERLSFYQRSAMTPRHLVEKLHRKGRMTQREKRRSRSTRAFIRGRSSRDERTSMDPPISLCFSMNEENQEEIKEKEHETHLYGAYRNRLLTIDHRLDDLANHSIENEREDLDRNKDVKTAREDPEEEEEEGPSSRVVYKPDLHRIPIGVCTPSFLDHLRYELSEIKRFWVCELHHRDWRPMFISSYYGGLKSSIFTPIRLVLIRLILCCILLLLEGFASADVYKDLGAPMFLYFTNWNSYLISIYFILLCIISLRAVYTFRKSSSLSPLSSPSHALERPTQQDSGKEEEERKKFGAPSITSTISSNASSSSSSPSCRDTSSIRKEEENLEKPHASSSSSLPPPPFSPSESSTPSIVTSSSTQENLPRMKSEEEEEKNRNLLSSSSPPAILKIQQEEKEPHEEEAEEEEDKRGCQRSPRVGSVIQADYCHLANENSSQHATTKNKNKNTNHPRRESLPGYRQLLSSREEVYSINGILLVPNPTNDGSYDSLLDPQQYLLPSCLCRGKKNKSRSQKKKKRYTPNEHKDDTNRSTPPNSILSSSSLSPPLSSSTSSSSPSSFVPSSPRTPLLISLTWILHTIQLIASTAVFLIFFTLLKQNGNTFPEAWYSVWKHLLIVLITFSHSFFLTYIPIPLKHIIFAYIFIMIYLGVQTLVYLLNLSNGDGGYGYVYKVFDMHAPLRALGVSILVLLSISVLLLIIWSLTRKRNLLVDPPPSVALSAYEVLQLQRKNEKEEENDKMMKMLVMRRMQEGRREKEGEREDEQDSHYNKSTTRSIAVGESFSEKKDIDDQKNDLV